MNIEIENGVEGLDFIPEVNFLNAFESVE